MDTAVKCVDIMDFSEGWIDWKNALKQSIESSRTYYHDETVQNLLTKLDIFLNTRVCASSVGEEIIDKMWEVATSEERKTMAMLFLKIADTL